MLQYVDKSAAHEIRKTANERENETAQYKGTGREREG